MLRVLSFIAALLAPAPAWAVIALVNTAVGSDATGSTVASISATAISVTANNLLVVACRQGTDNTTAPTVSDTAGNSFSSITTASFDSGNLITLFYAKGVTGNGADIVKCSWSVNQQFVTVLVLQYSGADATAPLDTSANGTATSAGTVTSGNFTTTAANEVLVTAFSVGQLSNTFSILTAGWAIENQDASQFTAIGDSIVSSIQTGVNVQAHIAVGSANWEIVVGTFKQASGGGAACPQTLALMGVGC